MRNRHGKAFRKKTAALLCLVVLFGICMSGCGENGEQIESIADLQGKTIVSMIGAMHAADVKENEMLAGNEFIYAVNNSDCLGMLMNGKAEAFATDYLVAKTLIKEYDGLKILDEVLNISSYSFGFPKGDPLKDDFNRVLAQMRQDGRIDAMLDKWTAGLDESVPEQIWPGKNGVLKCYVSSGYEPVCYLDGNGTMCGLDIELLLNIAEELDYRIKFYDEEFNDLFPSLIAGEADLIASGVSITEESGAYADFTDGYLDVGTALIVRDAEKSVAGQSLSLSVRNSFQRTFMEENRWLSLLSGLGITLMLSVVTTMLGVLLGGTLFLWDYSGNKLARTLLPKVTSFFSLLPVSTWLLICYYIIFGHISGANFLAAIFGLGFSFGLNVYSTLTGSLGTIPAGQIDAAASMGYDRRAALKNILLPQMMPKFLESVEGELVEHIRDTSIVEFVAVQDIQSIADMISGQTAEPFLPLAITTVTYVLLGAIASKLVRKLRLRICPDSLTEEAVKKRMMRRGRTKW